MFDGKEYVYAVYEEKSFSKAAQKLYITQPALSTAIKKVEKKIGTPIFDRSTSPIGLTPGGEVYIDAIEKLFALEQNTLNQLNNLNGLLAGKLSVGGTIFFTSFVLPGVLSEFSHRYPQIKIDLQEGTTTQLTDKLVAEELDLLIDNSELDDKNYEKYYYSTERIILAVPKSFPINEELTQYQLTAEDIRAGRHSQAEFPVLPLPLLKSTPFIFVKEENSIYKRSMKMCSRQNYSPNIIMKPDQVVSAFNMAGRGVGATFIPDGLIVNLPYEVPLCFYKMNEELAVRYVYLYKKRNKYLTKAMEEFIRVAVGDEAFQKVRDQREKENQEKKGILEHCRVCSIAFSGDEYPYVIPLNYGFVWNEDQETPVLYFHGAPVGTKIEHMERDNRVAFCVQNEKEIKILEPACRSTMIYESVCGTGRLSRVADPGEKGEALTRIMQQYDPEGGPYEFAPEVAARTTVLCLRVETLTGKSNAPKPEQA